MTPPEIREPRQWDFPPLVRELLEKLKPRTRPGEFGRAADEGVRFRGNPSMGFPTSDVEGLDWPAVPGRAAAADRARVTVNFMGLYGSASPLPTHYSQELLWQVDDPEGERVRDFLDLFNHRMISFIFRAREKYRHALRFNPQTGDEISERLLALAGLDSAEFLAAAGAGVRPVLRAMGPLAALRRSAAGLEEALRANFPEVDVRVRCCIVRRLAIPEDQRLYLKAPRRTLPRPGDAMTGLGRDTCIGTSRLDASSAFRISLGPLAYKDFRRFLPGAPDHELVSKITRIYVRDPLDFDIELHLRAAERPALRLTDASGLGLGHSTWVAPTDSREGRVRLPALRPHSHRSETEKAAARDAA